MVAVWVIEVFLLFVVIVLPRQIARLLPYAPPKVQPLQGGLLLRRRTAANRRFGGAQSGNTGRAGGQEAHHRTQTIRVARGNSLSPKVVDAPNLKLPASMDAVANLIAFKPVPGPPPSEGLHASLTLPTFPNVVAPAQTHVTRDRSRRGLTLDSVVPPAPDLSSDKPLSAPSLKSNVVPPAPTVAREHVPVAPTLNSM